MIKLKIRTQLIIGFAIIFVFVLILGFLLITQTTKIAEQTTLLYNHPVKVRQALSELQKDILLIHRDMKSMILTDDPDEVTELIALTEMYEADAFTHIDTLNENYLGPLSDIEEIEHEFIYWNTIRDETIQLLLTGNEEEAAYRTQSYGVGGKQANVVIASLQVVDDYSLAKTEEFYLNAQAISSESTVQSIVTVVIIILLMFLIYYFLFKNIRTPLTEILTASQQFIKGDTTVRSKYKTKNEFGELSGTFNDMADSIQLNYDLFAKREKFSELILSENELKPFFSMILKEFIEQSNSQVGTVYLLSEDHQKYHLLESIGLKDHPEKTFLSQTKEGEFGLVLAKKEIYHLRGLNQNSIYNLKTVVGEFIPNELITIPLIIENRIPVIISLASVKNFSPEVLRYIHEVWKLLNARLTGLLAMDRIRNLAFRLEQQNKELDSQTSELLSQSIELNQQNIELELQKKQLDQTNQMKTSFISNMSHELRTPLNSIIALSGVLSRHLENKIPEDEYSYLEVIERNGKQLLDLINEILDISRIESGREELEFSQFNLSNLLTEVVSNVLPLADQKNLKIVQNYPSELTSIMSDPKKCRHIFQNIIGNAIKFTEQGKVEISVQEKNNQFVVEVRDTGIGIAQGDIDRIFEEFRQADESTRRRFGGTGLGLSIARKYAELIGGTITVISDVGKGSLFTIHLPKDISIIRSKSEKHFNELNLKQISPVSQEEKSTTRILIVEDSEPEMIQLQDILSFAGYQSLFARNGKEALETIFVTQPDAILLDLMMPEVDGFDVLETIRNDDRTENIPVLVLTAKIITPEELNFLKRNQVYQLIQKGSINRTELLTAIESMISSAVGRKETPEKVNKTEKRKSKTKVLVVEDNPDNMLTAKALLKHGYEVMEATDGEMGLMMAKRRTPDLILLDIALPKMDGIQVIKAIKADIKLAKIKIIALTASVMTEDREAVLAHGFDGFISKPIDHTEFIQTIRQVLYGDK